MSKLSFKGTIAGGIVDIALSVVCGIFIEVYVAISVHLHYAAKDRIHAQRIAIHNQYWMLILIGYLCSVVGGYVAARIAGHDELLNGAASAWLCVLFAVVAFTRSSLHLSKGYSEPSLWVHPLLMVGSMLCGLTGGYLAMRRAKRRLPLT